MNARRGEPILAAMDARDYVLRTIRDRSSGSVLSFDVRVSTTAEVQFFYELRETALRYGYEMSMGARKVGFVVVRFLRIDP